MSEIKVDTVAEKTSANGVTVDGLNIKDSKLVTANSVVETNLTDNIVTLAKMASGTDGNIISYDASGNPVAIATGSDGQVLTSTGAGSPPAFEALPSSGRVLQIVQASFASQVAIASTSYTDTGITLAITPSATSSKILVMVFIQYTAYADNNGEIKSNARIMRDSTGVFESVSVLGSQVGTGNSGYQQTWGTLPLSYLDSPSSISAITYKVTAKNSTTSGNRQLKINHDSVGKSTITLMEVSA